MELVNRERSAMRSLGMFMCHMDERMKCVWCRWFPAGHIHDVANDCNVGTLIGIVLRKFYCVFSVCSLHDIQFVFVKNVISVFLFIMFFLLLALSRLQ